MGKTVEGPDVGNIISFISDTLILRYLLKIPEMMQVWASGRSYKFECDQHLDSI